MLLINNVATETGLVAALCFYNSQDFLIFLSATKREMEITNCRPPSITNTTYTNILKYELNYKHT